MTTKESSTCRSTIIIIFRAHRNNRQLLGTSISCRNLDAVRSFPSHFGILPRRPSQYATINWHTTTRTCLPFSIDEKNNNSIDFAGTSGKTTEKKKERGRKRVVAREVACHGRGGGDTRTGGRSPSTRELCQYEPLQLHRILLNLKLRCHYYRSYRLNASLLRARK